MRARALDDIVARGRLPILAGGTGLYFHALLHGLSPMPEADAGDARAASRPRPASAAGRRCTPNWPRIDPAAAARIHATDAAAHPARARGLSASPAAPISDWQARARAAPRLPLRVLKLVLAPRDRAVLHARIERRFDAMLDAGFLDEVRACAHCRSCRRIRAAGPAGDARGRLPPGLGAPGRRRRPPATFRDRGDLRHPPAGQAPADLAARRARRALVRPAAPSARALEQALARCSWPAALDDAGASAVRGAPTARVALPSGPVAAAGTASGDCGRLRQRPHHITRTSWGKHHVQGPVFAGSFPECAASRTRAGVGLPGQRHQAAGHDRILRPVRRAAAQHRQPDGLQARDLHRGAGAQRARGPGWRLRAVADGRRATRPAPTSRTSRHSAQIAPSASCI